MSSIAYDLKKIKGFVFDIDGVLSPTVIPMSETGEPLRMVNIKDGYALQLAVKHGYKIAIITGGRSIGVETRFRALGIQDIFQGIADKLPVLKEWLCNAGLGEDEVIYMGDDIPDLKCLRHVKMSACPHDAAQEVRATALYISPFDGGYGCARDILRQTMVANGDWMNDTTAFGW